MIKRALHATERYEIVDSGVETDEEEDDDQEGLEEQDEDDADEEEEEQILINDKERITAQEQEVEHASRNDEDGREKENGAVEDDEEETDEEDEEPNTEGNHAHGSERTESDAERCSPSQRRQIIDNDPYKTPTQLVKRSKKDKMDGALTYPRQHVAAQRMKGKNERKKNKKMQLEKLNGFE